MKNRAAVLGLFLLTTHCATDQAHQVREKRPVTVGFVGAAYRPIGNLSLVAAYDGSNVNHYVDNTRQKVRVTKVDDTYTLKINHREARLIGALHLYPSKTSAFFVGVSGEKTSKTLTWDEETTSSAGGAPLYTSVKMKGQDNLVGLVLGWDWIWNNGFSLFLDIGPRWVSSTHATYADDGSAKGVDTEKRDATEATLLKYEKSEMRFGSGVIAGYSF